MENYHNGVYEFQAAGGTAGAHNLFIVGNSSAYNDGLAQDDHIVIGGGFDANDGTEYNELIIRNGSFLTRPPDSSIEFHSDNNTLTVTGANSGFALSHGSSPGYFVFAADTTGTVVQALDGGIIRSRSYDIRSNASVTFNVDGADSELVSDLGLRTASVTVATINVGNGGTFQVALFSDADGTVNLNLNDGGTLVVGSLDVGNIDNFNFEAGATIRLGFFGALTGLSSIDSGRTVDLTESFAHLGSATTLNGGTLTVLDLDYANTTNLTFTSGTLHVTNALTNLDATSAGQTVILDDGNWSPSGNIDAGDTTIQNSGSLTVGDYSATNLTFTNGSLTTTGALTNLNTFSSANQTVILDGGTWSPSGNIDAGDTTIQNSGALTVGDYRATNLTFTSGSLTTTGALTNLNATGAGQTIILDGGTWSPTGNIDASDTTIQNSGSLSVIGAYDATNLTFTSGSLTSTGALTNLPTISAGLSVDISSGGSFGDATTLDGGSVAAATLDATNLTFTSGSLTTTGALTNLNATGAGQTVILDGGTWSPTGNIDASDTTVQNSGSLSVIGAFDATNLTFTSGDLTIAGDASNLPDIVVNNAVTLTGGGSLLTATTLNGGTLTGGDFDLNSNLTFTSGTLNVSGTLQNLSHLPTGTAVNMDGGSADLILSQDLVITGGTLNIDNGASVTVLNDVTLGAGVLGFDSNGGNLDMDGGTLNVASMATALTLNANASITGNGTIYGDIGLGTGGTIDGDATGLRVYGDISGTGTIADTTLFGNLNIGNSPGDVILENATLSSSTIVALAIEGVNQGEFDTLTIDGASDISAATLNITFSGFTPDGPGDTFALLGNFSATNFSTITTPDGWNLSNAGVLSGSAVPEPSSLALLAGLFAVGFTATRRGRRA